MRGEGACPIPPSNAIFVNYTSLKGNVSVNQLLRLLIAGAGAMLIACAEGKGKEPSSNRSDQFPDISTTGTIKRTCAPTDGAQVTILLSSESSSLLKIRLNKGLEESKGEWSIGNFDGDGGLWIELCDGGCLIASDGRLLINQITETHVGGQLDAQFGETELRGHDFNAEIDTSVDQKCG